MRTATANAEGGQRVHLAAAAYSRLAPLLPSIPINICQGVLLASFGERRWTVFRVRAEFRRVGASLRSPCAHYWLFTLYGCRGDNVTLVATLA